MTTLLREVTPRKFVELTRIREADGVTIDKAARTARVVIITEGLGNLRDRNFYTAEAIASSVKTFEGKQFYLDHPAESEEKDRPERSVRDLAGYFSDCTLSEVNDLETGERLTACFATLHFSESDAGNQAFGQVQTAIEYQRRYPDTKDVYCGISINGGGISHPGTIQDMQVNMVTEIQEAFSADVVTKPARGGKFLALMQEADKTSALKRRWANQERRRAQEGRGRVVMATVVPDNKEADRRAVRDGARRTREAGDDERGELTGEPELDPDKAQAGARTRLLRVAQDLRKKLKTATEQDGLDPKTILADVQSDLDMLSGAIDALGGNGEVMAGENEGQMLTGAAAESARSGKGKGAGTVETRTADRKTNEGDRTERKTKPGLSAAREAEEEAQRQAEGEGEQERAGEGEGRREGEGEQERAGEGEGYQDENLGMDAAGEHDMGDEMGGQRMQYKCAKCSTVNTVAPPRGYQMVASEARTTEASALAETAARLERRLLQQETRFERSNREKSQLIRENIKLRAENQANKRLEDATKLLKEARVPADILAPQDLLLIENVAEWPVHIKAAQRMLTREAGTYLGGNRSRDGGVDAGGGAKGDADKAISKFDESYKAAK